MHHGDGLFCRPKAMRGKRPRHGPGHRVEPARL